ncbi:hypothetical protein F2P56_003774, partial [Juglans regia]
MANSHRCNNAIEMLRTENNLLSLPAEIQEHVVQFFSSLLSETEAWRPTIDGLNFAAVDNFSASWPERPFEELEPCGYFPSSRGLRQGDPLSPFLFDIVMEALSCMVEVVVGAGFISGFSVGTNSNGPSTISHLLFYDDTLIFCEAVGEQIQVLRVVLLCFQAISGLKVNLS